MIHTLYIVGANTATYHRANIAQNVTNFATTYVAANVKSDGQNLVRAEYGPDLFPFVLLMVHQTVPKLVPSQ